MAITEREVEQDFTVVWPAFYVLAAIAIGLMLFAAATSPSLEHWLFCAGVVGFILIFTRIGLRGSLRDLRASGKTWKVTDAGLQRVYPSGKAETIRWAQIRRMRWVKWCGLIVRWEEPEAEHRQRDRAFRREFRWDAVSRTFGARLRVRREDAMALKSIAGEQTGLSL